MTSLKQPKRSYFLRSNNPFGLAAFTFTVLFCIWLISRQYVLDIKKPLDKDSDLPINYHRKTAIKIAPLKLYNLTLEDKTLELALIKLRPEWHIPKTNSILHSLRLWGDSFDPINLGIEFASSPSSIQLLQVMHNMTAASFYNVTPIPFIFKTRYGLSVQYQTTGGGIAHHDQYLKVMGELGLSTDREITFTDNSKAKLADVVKASLYEFDLDQEIEFTAVAYSRWLPPSTSWKNRRGVKTDFDELCQKLLGKPLGKSSCLGIHNLYALANIYRVNQLYKIVSDKTSKAIETRLSEVSGLLSINQRQNGLWNQDWATISFSNKMATQSALEEITATGHHLEWISIVPAHLRPDISVVLRAANALAHIVIALDDASVSGAYAPCSHAVRSLLMLQGYEDGSSFFNSLLGITRIE